MHVFSSIGSSVGKALVFNWGVPDLILGETKHFSPSWNSLVASVFPESGGLAIAGH